MASIWDLISSGREAYNQGEIPAPQGAAPRVANYQQPKLNPNLKRGLIAPIGYDNEGNAEWAIPQGLLDMGESIARMSEASNPYTPFPYENYGDITGDALNVGVLGGATSFATKGVPKGALASGLSKQAKDPKDRTEAFKVAQRNAALPVEKGGLGLPKDNTAADRAKAMGFDVEGYHGTNQGAYTKEDIREFNTRPDSMRGAAFFSSNPDLARQYGEKVYNVLLKSKEPLTVHGDGRSWVSLEDSPISGNLTKEYADLKTKKNEELQSIFEEMSELFGDVDTPEQAEKIVAGILENKTVSSMPNISGGYIATDDIAKSSRDLGYDLVHFKDIYDSPTSGVYDKVKSDVYAVHNPSHIRSTKAAFDPARADSADILAANPELMGLLGAARQKEEEQRGLLNGY